MGLVIRAGLSPVNVSGRHCHTSTISRRFSQLSYERERKAAKLFLT
jgi:hypothetical protein